MTIPNATPASEMGLTQDQVYSGWLAGDESLAIAPEQVVRFQERLNSSPARECVERVARANLERARGYVAKAYKDSVGVGSDEFCEDYLAGHFDEGHDIQAVLSALAAMQPEIDAAVLAERERCAEVAKECGVMAIKSRLAAAIPSEISAGKRAKAIAYADGYLQAVRDLGAAIRALPDHVGGLDEMR